MFAKSVIDSDKFLDMPLSAQNLYFHLCMRADDDGFVNSPKKIMKITDTTPDDLNILKQENFLISFDSGVVVIRHWKVHNNIAKDRYKETVHQEEKKQLTITAVKTYEMYTDCIQTVYNPDTQVRLDKVSSGKDSIICEDKPSQTKTTKFIEPTLQEVKDFCKVQNYTTDPERFIDYYTAKGWLVGKNKMKDWKAALRMWERNGKTTNKPTPSKFNNFYQKPTNFEEIKIKKKESLMKKLETMKKS